MKNRAIVLFCTMFVLALASSLLALAPAVNSLASGRTALPLAAEAKDILNSTHRHGEWIRVPSATGQILNWVVYPDRADKTAVVVISAKDQKISDWLRAVADQVALEGFVAVVPEATTSMEQQLNTVRDFMVKLPAANGKDARLSFSSNMHVSVGKRAESFPLSGTEWSKAMSFLNRFTQNDPSRVVFIPSHVHSPTFAMAEPAQQQPAGGARGGPRGYPGGKLDDLPAGIFTAKTTVLRSPIKAEWIDIPTPGIYTGKMHTRITYPQGDGKAGIVIVMQHGPGMDEWMQSVGDQLSRQGFIALVADLHTGMGPNGGNYDSFSGPDGAFGANARLMPATTIAAYKAVRDYGMKLPRANGKSASIGFCMGGNNSWIFAIDIPELSAAVVYYGTPPNDEAQLAKIKAPVLGFYGEDDARITATVEGTRATMKKLGKSYEGFIYPHATHGFLEFQDLGGNAAATSDSWARTSAFLKANLQ